MSYFARIWGRDSRGRPARTRFVLEALEGRTMLSGTGATSGATISSQTTLYTNLPTAVTGSQVNFAALVQNASNHAPITSGTVNFVVESPKKIVLGNVSLDSMGEAFIDTKDLTAIGNYQVEATYAPSTPNVSTSMSMPLNVKVVPVPLNVPTVTTLVSGAQSAEVGQQVPLFATVDDAGTGVQVDAGKVEPITGQVEFIEDSPNPVVLGTVNLNKHDQASLSTNMLKNVGPYQIEAKFVPANNFFAGSTSVPASVTITPKTVNAPTVTSITPTTNSIETGEAIGFSATVQNNNSSLADGVVKFVTVARHPEVLGKVDVSTFGQTVGLTTPLLTKVGTYQIVAEYVPNTNSFATSTSPPVDITVTPLTAASFRVTPTVPHGHIGVPLSFNVTALSAQNQPVTNYTGTVVFSSPTDSSTIFPASTYKSLNTPAPSPLLLGLASFTTQSYTFTLADHGSHTFVGAVTFGKGGAETIQVTQANNHIVHAKATFAIA
jgi:Bacterial Ig-like domain (group 3)